MGTWWTGARLVFERGLVENLRSKSFKVVTGLLLVLAAASVLLPQLLTGGTRTYTLATVGRAPPDLTAALAAAGRAGEFDVEYVVRGSPGAVRAAVRHSDATVGLTRDTLYAAAEDAGTFPAVVAQAVVSLESARRLAAAGLTPQQLAELRSVRPPTQVSVGAVREEGRTNLGVAVGLVLEMALLFAGSAIATAVAVEKTTRISEVLLAALRPSQILVGTVLAVGTVTLVDLLVLGAPIAVAVQVNDDLGLPAVAAGDIALAVTWFLLGFALYAFVYAVCGALVEKVTEVGNVVLPVAMVIFGGYFAAFLVILGEGAQNPWGVALSMFPLTAPLAMPIRWASGEVPVYQLVIAMALTAGTAVALVSLASVTYRRALVITGRRVRFREVVGRRAAP